MTPMRLHPLVCATTLVGAVLAQGTIVSPAGLATVEGDNSNTFPFVVNTVRRYMQIHGDLGSTPRLLTQLSFRAGASTLNLTGTRTYDLELYMGDGVSTLVPNLVLDSNYVGTKVVVIPRTLITWGPQGQSVMPGPNPFTGNTDLLLPTPFGYLGTHPLVWETAHFGVTAVGNFSSLDADGSSSMTAPSTVTGPGCVATGEINPMTHTYTVHDSAGTLLMNPTISLGPANSLCQLAIGFSNPNLVVPGLCGTVYTDAQITTVLGFTSATGSFTADTPTAAIVVPNVLAGLPMYTQCFAVDLGLVNPVQFVCSNGRLATVPAPQTASVNLVSRLWNNVGSPSTTTAAFGTSIAGFALVTQFSHL